MTQSTEARLRDIHTEALIEFDEIQTALRDERLQCLKDRRFCTIAGAQWEGPLGDQFENKPRYEFNKVHLAVIRVVNEYRNNRITVDFTAKDGSQDDKLADTCDGLYRADEKAYTADEAYDNAFEEGVQGGFGAWRLRACYEDEESDDDDRQRIRMEPIFDADSTVFFDLNAKRQDKSDAKRCYVLNAYSPRAYAEEFDDDPSTWSKDVHQSEFDWNTPNIIWVCELYKVEETTQLIHYFRGLDDQAADMKVTDDDLAADLQMLAQLKATGFREVRQKRVKKTQIHKYLLSGGKVLEDCGIIPGRCIPIIPFFGKRWVIDGVERCMGHVRLATDAQRLTNMLLSWLAEMAARFDIEKPIVTPEQIAGHAMMWAQDNVKKFPYLLLNAVTDEQGNRMPTAPIGYTKAPNIPPAMAALLQIAMQALEDLLGNQEAGEQLQPNLSGKAVELIQNRLDMQVFIYMSNLSKSMKRSGEVWLSMMKDIVTETSRRMKTIDSSGKTGSVVMNDPTYDPDTGTEYLENDLTKATFDVDVDVGPSSSSRRAATVRALTAMKQGTQDPETLAVLDGLAMLNMEGEGLDDARAFFRRKLVRMGAVKPTEDEQAEMAQEQAQQAGQPPDPQSQYLLAAAEQAGADAGASRAKTVDTIADAQLKMAMAEKTRADTAKSYAQAMGEHNDQQIATAQALHQMLYAPPPSGQ
jgi:Phage P22-like portal protein